MAFRIDHRRAVWMMVAAATMWSIAGVVTRQLEVTRGFEVTFWRSAFNALALVGLLSWLRGPGELWRSITGGGRALWLSGVCWCVMFTAFMLAITLTTVANVLITLAVGPLFTSLAARVVLGHRLAPRTWMAILLAGIGIAWMYGREVSGAEPRHVMGTLIALAVPVAGAVNWTLMQYLRTRAEPAGDMLPSVLIGALMSSAITLPLSMPFGASGADVGWLALLGVVQLAIPCLIAVAASKVLPAPEISLMALLEVVLGVLWAWLGAGEAPSMAVLGGGALVLGALVFNEVLALREPVR